jgi:hypothetical protein
MQLVRLMWQPDHPTIPWRKADEWLAYIRDNAKDTIQQTMGDHAPCMHGVGG